MTKRQKEVLEFIKSYQEENEVAPLLIEIADEFNVVPSTAFGILNRLEENNKIKRNGKHRGLRIIENHFDPKKYIDEFEDRFMTADSTKKEEEMFDWIQDTLKEISE